MNKFYFCLIVCIETQILDFNLWNNTWSDICSKSAKKKKIVKQPTKQIFCPTLNKYYSNRKLGTEQ